MNVAETVSLIEAAGATFRLDGNKVHVRYTSEEQRHKLVAQVAFLREYRADVAGFLKFRDETIPVMPSGVRLLAWDPKEPPIALETFLLVTDSVLFARAALREISERLTNPKRKYGRPVAQLVAHLARVGVLVVLNAEIQGGALKV
jgi:hypothetical protein